MKKEYYSITEAAAFLGCHASWVYQLVQTHKLAYEKVGSFYMIPTEALRKYKRTNRKKAAK